MTIDRPPKAIFALTSEGKDVYSAMTRVAIASLRASNPQLRLLLACDRQSDEALHRSQDPVIDEVDDWLVIDTPYGPPIFRNRHVKTRLRSLLEGTFLFLDSDVFVRGSLSEIFDLDCDVAGGRNHSREIFSEQLWDQDRATLDAMGWTTGDEVYLNGGVLFFKDTVAARALATEWHQRWTASAANRCSYRDQPALNSALEACRPRLAVLPDRFNAQLIPSPEVAIDAVIWHFYSSAERPQWTNFDVLVRGLLEGSKLDPVEISRCAALRHPWTGEGVVEASLQLAALRTESTLQKRELAALRRDHELLQQDMGSILASRSWRLTRPLRDIDAFAKRRRRGSATPAIGKERS